MLKRNFRKILISKTLIFLLSVIFFNYWIWKIIIGNLLLGILIIISTFYFVRISKGVFNHKLDLLFICSFFLLVYLTVSSGFDKSLIVVTPGDLLKINDRHGYFSAELGKAFQNRFSLKIYSEIYPLFYKYQNNLFSNLDPNLYFFGSHPRERAGIAEFNKYPSIYIIFFIVGVLYLTAKANKYLIIFSLIVIIASGFISPGFKYGPVLFFPLINVILFWGIVYSAKKMNLKL